MTHQLEMEGGGLPARPSILALDMSLTHTGYCLNGETGVIASRKRGWDRIAEITSRVYELTFGVDVVVIEGYSYGSKGQAVYQIAELGGIIRFWLYTRRMLTVEITPSTLKKFATGKGNAPKSAMVAAAVRRFHLPEGHDDDNEADAYLLWAAAREAYGGPIAKVPADRAALIHRLNWPKVELHVIRPIM